MILALQPSMIRFGLDIDRTDFSGVALMRHEITTMRHEAGSAEGRTVRSELPDPAVMAGKRDERDQDPGGPGTSVIAKTRPQTKRPSLYRVLLLNDDYTPMEFVVHILQKFFNKSTDDATRIMLHVHQHGVGECGVYTYEVAETKVTQVMDFARKNQHPLQCVMEKK